LLVAKRAFLTKSLGKITSQIRARALISVSLGFYIYAGLFLCIMIPIETATAVTEARIHTGDLISVSLNPEGRSETNMATRSITDPFAAKAADFYRAAAEADEKAEERRKRQAPPDVRVRRMTDDEAVKMMDNK